MLLPLTLDWNTVQSNGPMSSDGLHSNLFAPLSAAWMTIPAARVQCQDMPGQLGPA